MLDPEHGLRGVVEAKTVGRGEGEAEPRMQEAPAAHEAFARILAKHDSVDAGEIRGLVASTARGLWSVELERVGGRVAGPLRRRRMRGRRRARGRRCRWRRLRIPARARSRPAPASTWRAPAPPLPDR